MAAANEQIGIAMSAFYPTLTLSAEAGLQSLSFMKWFSWPSRFWAVGPELAETLFDAGRRKAVVVEERAGYGWLRVANYRQTSAFRDATGGRQPRGTSYPVSSEIGKGARKRFRPQNRALTVSTAQYRGGTTTYLSVITEQAALLNAEDTATQLLTRRFAASVLLIQALGGGWDTSQLPSARALTTGSKN